MSAEIDEALTKVNEAFSSIAAAVAGYQAKMEAAGFTTANAQTMAVAYHAVLLGVISATLQRAIGPPATNRAARRR